MLFGVSPEMPCEAAALQRMWYQYMQAQMVYDFRLMLSMGRAMGMVPRAARRRVDGPVVGDRHTIAPGYAPCDCD